MPSAEKKAWLDSNDKNQGVIRGHRKVRLEPYTTYLQTYQRVDTLHAVSA